MSNAKTNYVLVGAGPAGFVLAEQLTRNPDVNVVLLEVAANGDDTADVYVPGNLFNIFDSVWYYLSQPEPILNGAQPDSAQGKLVGGGTAVNAMLHCRGSASVFDEWAEISGNEGLAWNNILEAFKDTTHWIDAVGAEYEQQLNTSAFGDGPLEVTRQRQRFPFDQPFVDTIAAEHDLPEIDFASGGGIGVTQGLVTIRASNATRSYAYNTFGYLANARSNFQLITHAWVSKIGFDEKTASSVTYNDTVTNTAHTLQADEIIITAGTINSAQLLMLSGVGPMDQLTSHGIEVVEDVPGIGSNLMDHRFAVVQYNTTEEQPTRWKYENNATWAAEQEALWNATGDGVLGTDWGDAMGAVRLPDSVFEGTGDFYTKLPADRPHIAYIYSSVGTQAEPNATALTVWAAMVQPESRGNVTLATADYRDPPLIHANFWATPGERALIQAGYQEARRMFSAPSLRTVILAETFPGPNVTEAEDVWEAIVESSRSWHHQSGTVSLGTVLDADWRVKGLKGLRVVGAASIPQIPTCPIQASVYALAKVAALDVMIADGLA
ncbi:hypothetical protein CERZMDRAFT_47819 [Cercospora zeae-maydis SCOH1-5]|uniref:Glucose-methanol-choline oxidoreductase N-terminal domain-containing protein n=1 Tax=Cercospora zeae-maydis SCOH1-5 TaxID=717836 RepID=A0A6A6F772_9PEZI|nr:hypothetical protein CERZMDRAFT_47819 [Cercospora zeae-maydis SCOH1-5]